MFVFSACPDLPVPGNSALSPSERFEGITVTMTCEGGYTQVGADSTTCSSGSWNDALGSCKQSCPELTVPGHSTPSTLDRYEGITVTMNCATGYIPVGADSTTCLSGSWNDTLGFCKQVCPELTVPSHSTLSSSDRYEGKRVTMTCESGYSPIGVNNITCTSGAWTETFGICEQDCPTPTLTHGTVTAPTTVYGSEASYSCNPGYNLNGAQTRICEAGGTWSGTDASCNPVELGDHCALSDDCSTNTNNSECSSVTLTCTCSQGYRRQDNSCVKYALDDTCTEDVQCSTYNPQSYCKPKSGPDFKTCDCLTGYRNAGGSCTKYALEDDCASGSADCDTAVTNSQCSEANSGVFKCFCKTGYYGVAGGSQCEQIYCGAPPLIKHATLILTNESTTFVATYTCDSGYDLPDAQMNKKECVENANDWSDDNVTCHIKGNCAIDPPSVANATPTLSDDGNTATYTCVKGYELKNAGDGRTSTCTGSSWSEVGDLCKLKECLSPGGLAPANGSIEYTVRTYGATGKITCNEGYTLEGTGTTITCLDTKQWSTHTITCKIKDCLAPPPPTHGNVTLADPGVTTYTAIATQSCNTGYEISGVETIRCTTAATWSAPPANCTIKTCGKDNLPQPTDGVSILDEADVATYGATATQTCNPGYTPSEEGLKLKCLETGLWEEVTLTCTIKNCGPPPTLANGAVQLDVSNTTTYDAEATLNCIDGYKTDSNQDKIKCLETGQWAEITRVCTKKDCTAPPVPAHGSVTLAEAGVTTYEANATQSCDTGYDLTGEENIRCTADATWSHPPVVCTIKNCGRLYAPINGKVNGQYGTATSTYGAVANFTCDNGFSLSGLARKECRANGAWSAGDNATCTKKATATCGTPAIQHSTFEYNADGTEATITCEDGYELANAAQNKLLCSTNNQWTAIPLPVCNLKGNRKQMSGLKVTIDIVLVNTDLDNPVIKLHIMVLTKESLLQKLRVSMNNPNVDIVITNIRHGSLVVDYDAIFPSDATNAFLDATTNLLASNDTIEIDGNVGEVLSVQVDNDTYTPGTATDYKCKAFETVEGACKSGYSCVVTDGVAVCKADKTEDNFAVIIGVGVGVPLGLLAIVLLVVFGIFINKKTRRRDYRYSESELSEGDQRRHYPTKLPTRYTGGGYGGYGSSSYYGPQHFESFSESQPPSRHRYAEGEPDSNFSWDFMYNNQFAPGNKFEIRRPKY